MKLEDENLIRRYLLGELNEQELAQVERRTMTDDDFFNQVQLMESELTEAYVSGELNEPERGTFEQRFLTTSAGRQNVYFNQAFLAHFAQAGENLEPSPVANSWRSRFAALWQYQKPLTAFSLATIALLLILSVWLAIIVGRLQSRVDDLQAQQTSSQSQTEVLKQQLDEANARATKLQNDVQTINEENAKLTQQIADLQTNEKKTGDLEPLGDSVFALVLAPGGDRSGTPETDVTLTPDKKILQLSLRVRQDIFKQFRAELSNRDSNAVLIRLNSVKVRKGESETLVIFQISAARLVNGDYKINLFGTTSQGKTEPVDRYTFSIRRNP
jgi:hypothetical protein